MNEWFRNNTLPLLLVLVAGFAGWYDLKNDVRANTRNITTNCKLIAEAKLAYAHSTEEFAPVLAGLSENIHRLNLTLAEERGNAKATEVKLDNLIEGQKLLFDEVFRGNDTLR